MTFSTYNIYNEALLKGFDVKIATIRLFDDWNYDIEIENFDESKFSISKPKKYDKK